MLMKHYVNGIAEVSEVLAHNHFNKLFSSIRKYCQTLILDAASLKFHSTMLQNISVVCSALLSFNLHLNKEFLKLILCNIDSSESRQIATERLKSKTA